jgi:hypothetical protein
MVDEYQVQGFARKVATNVTVAGTALFALAYMLVLGQKPDMLAVLSLTCIAVFVYNLTNVAIYIYQSRPMVPAKPENVVVDYDDGRDEAPAPSPSAAPGWADDVDWAGLAQYVATGQAGFSRTALRQWVPQRAYSPGDGTMSFPALMVRVGAAYSVANGGGLPSYEWSSRAASLLARITNVVGNGSGGAAGDHSPTPLVAA